MAHTLLGKLIKLRRSDWADLFAAQIALLRAQLLVWTRPRGTLLKPATSPAHAGTPPDRKAVAVALAIKRAAHYGLFRPNCLVRAVALQKLLQSRGHSGGTVRVGVQRQNGRLLAHAWVEYGGAVLGDEEWRVKQFDELARMGLGERRAL